MRWLKDNALQVVSMLGGVCMIIILSSIQLGSLSHAQEDITKELAVQKSELSSTRKSVVTLTSDVRVLGDRQIRLDNLVTRQEASIRRLDAIAIKLQAIIEGIHHD